MVLDTNIVIYFAKPGGEHLAPWVGDPAAEVSVVSRIEALAVLPEVGLGEAVAERAIALRQQRRMGLADAIIAATALEHDLPLVTHNTADFKHITGLRLIDPFDQP